MTLFERVKKLCTENKIAQRTVEKECGLSNGSISKWKTSNPSSDTVQKIAEFFNVNVEWLTGASEFRTKKEMFQHFDSIADLPALKSDVFRLEKGMKIPVLGDVAAGRPIFVEENYIGSEEISQDIASTGEFFGLRIKGDSMSPRISDGDTVIVRQQDDAENGDIVIVLINGDSATCKKLMKYKEGISLISFNPAYEPMSFTNKEIEDKPVCLIGKVVENRQKY